MIELDQTDQGATLRIREDSEDVVGRLGRLDLDAADLSEQLAALDRDKLTELAAAMNKAVARLSGGNGRSRPAVIPAPISRATRFGD